MYDFTFWFVYRFFEWRKGFESVSVAAMFVATTVAIHILFVYLVVRTVTGWSITPLGGSYTGRRLLYLPFYLLLYFLLYFGYYRRRGPEILKRFEEERFSQRKHVVRFICVFALPLIATIILAPKA